MADKQESTASIIAKAAAKSARHNLYQTTVSPSLVAHTAAGLTFSALAPMAMVAAPAALVVAPLVVAGAAVAALFAFSSRSSSR